MPCSVRRTLLRAAARLGALPLLAVALAAPAATTDIAAQPLITLSEVTAKPNLLFILDDSGSMDYAYMPDAQGSATTRYGFASTQCNGVAYDPSITYTPPVDATGTSYSAASFTAAWDDGYTQSGTTTNLQGTGTSYTASSLSTSSTTSATFTFTSGVSSSTFASGDTVTVKHGSGTSYSGTVTSWSSKTTTSGMNQTTTTTYTLVVTVSGFSSSGSGSWTVTTQGSGQTYYTYKGSQTAMGWTYGSTGAVVTTTTFYKECMSTVGASPGSSVFTAVTVTSSSSDAANYANWYSYYRKRYLLMRTAVGQAFASLDSNYRVGFMTINDSLTNTTDGTSYFRNVKDFDSTQKASFYTSLYSATRSSSTPLRAALAKAGRYFANLVSKQAYDPMEYACQRNFALLSTDGFWNETTGKYNLAASALIGDQDGDESRPMKDDNKAENTLADVAEYYYVTDLRTTALGNCTSTTSGSSQDVCSNSVPTSGRDTATHQHMTTFSVGLGVNGTLTYDKDYLTQTSGDYVALTAGTKSWPTPVSNTALAVDDLWHAAVNGRGQYYSAMNASSLSEAITSVVTAVKETTGSGTAAATNTLTLVAGDSNVVYQASYTTVSWTGELAAYTLDGTTGEIGTTATWSAQGLLDSKAAANRAIYFNKSGALTSFLYDNLSATQQAYFTGLCSKTVVAAQCSTLSTANKALANTGSHLVNYLRGVRTYEASNTTSPLFRTRSHVLGDIINSTPVYVGAPPFSYADTGYSAFKTARAARTAVVYTGANDGMLHAFSASTGEELWAYVPTAVMPNLYKLADTAYATVGHQYSVDGEAVEADIYVDGAWKTILVGGLNAGGQAYYALDITTPESPKLLWEFTDTHLGLSYGNPVITKLADGTWVTAFASGYNNTAGDGVGRLYVVNANTGAVLRSISTGAGSSATPSGLAKINVWLNGTTDNTALRFYGGDLLGNLWRFDTDSLVEPYLSALLLAKFQASDGTVQPITIQPLLKLISSTYPAVAIATGRYLGTSDITDTTTQSIAVLKDPLTSDGWGVVRNSASLVKQTFTASSTTVTGTSNSVDWSSQGGWWADLPTSGERIVTSMAIQSDTLIAASTVPSGDACTSGGSSWLYQISLLDGTATSTVAQLLSSSSIVVGFTTLTLASGTTIIVVKDSTGATTSQTYTSATGTIAGTPQRTSWRELVD
ncbi:pilus assembly protein [Xylophilus sp.]|uniref:pilus assembly protein n=1 Tax=Xylophilus sp. TaxID=2653893 RepID=UPI0013BE47AF|nr:PilC/PilY family type IV pilus protein [Xylophilus sp.]KAF1046656.1 MAG: Type IV pilus biogenesis factor PilY1 [Xylophilus sp.]